MHFKIFWSFLHIPSQKMNFYLLLCCLKWFHILKCESASRIFLVSKKLRVVRERRGLSFANTWLYFFIFVAFYMALQRLNCNTCTCIVQCIMCQMYCSVNCACWILQFYFIERKIRKIVYCNFHVGSVPILLGCPSGLEENRLKILKI